MADQGELGEILAAASRTQVDLQFVADPELCITDVNPAALDATGYPRDQLLGRPVLDLVHPDDVDTATVGLVLVGRPDAALRVNPIYLRLRHAEGHWLHLDVNGSIARTADGTERFVFIGRPSDDLDLSERLIRLLIAGTTATEAFALVPEFGRWRQPAFDYAVVHRDDDGRATASGGGDLPALAAATGLDDPTTPWHRAAATGTDVVAPVDGLDPAFAEAARRAGIEFVRCQPVIDPLHRDAAVVVVAQRAGRHGQAAGNLLPLLDYLFERMAMMLGLVVAWRKQVVELRRSAATDPLTGLANRAGFWSTLDAGERHRRRSLLYVDLDRFKVVNDAHGHAFGDALLVAVADRLASAMRPGDVIARLGGDEFGVVLDGADAATAEAVADRLVASLTEPFMIDGIEVEVGASVGVATTDSSAIAPADLLAAADRALYRAKGSGRGGRSTQAVG